VLFEYNSLNNFYKLIAPMNRLSTLKIKLQAYVNNNGVDEQLEECEFTISNEDPENLYLYEHDISSPICK
jgi:hypothetical protein